MNPQTHKYYVYHARNEHNGMQNEHTLTGKRYYRAHKTHTTIMITSFSCGIHTKMTMKVMILSTTSKELTDFRQILEYP